MASKPKMSSVIKLEGLMVFHYDDRTRICQVGVLKADHMPREHSKMPPHVFGITVNGRQVDLVRFKTSKESRWTLDVESGGKKSGKGEVTTVNRKPINRHNPNGDQVELGWLIDVQNEFHTNEPLRTKAGALKPIIEVRAGRMYTCCKTDGIDVYGGQFGWGRSFGFMAESIAIGFDTEYGEEIVLQEENTGEEVFRLKYREQGYKVAIENVPNDERADGHKEGPGDGSEHDHEDMPPTAHFELYYALFYEGWSDMVHLQLSRPAEESPNLCAMSPMGDKKGPLDLRSVYPYKCGGIAHGQPLT